MLGLRYRSEISGGHARAVGRLKSARSCLSNVYSEIFITINYARKALLCGDGVAGSLESGQRRGAGTYGELPRRCQPDVTLHLRAQFAMQLVSLERP
ncbi:hypothetical protein EVAR_79466_1 [Eumeta japonica]|uniref:Uncharacterized protein n=1 Tax=Eumeta variegata TaxID=151549 RepID=A0A4C1UDV8_EUMVA|nr:hypothetical protein EVAR_79466_1 [Eumeta japonica]